MVGDDVRAVLETVPGGAPEAQAEVTSLGGTVESRYGGLVQQLVPPGSLEELSQDPAVQRVRPPLRPVPDSVDGQEVGALNATPWQAAGVTGAGVKLGIIDHGFAGYATLWPRATSRRPRTTTDFCGPQPSARTTAHGTAVAEVVHEVAPGAELYLLLRVNRTRCRWRRRSDRPRRGGISIIATPLSWFNSGRGTARPRRRAHPTRSRRRAPPTGSSGSTRRAIPPQRHWSGVFQPTVGNELEQFHARRPAGGGFHLHRRRPDARLAEVGRVAGHGATTSISTCSRRGLVRLVAGHAEVAVLAATSSRGRSRPTEEFCYTNPGAGRALFSAIHPPHGRSAIASLRPLRHGGVGARVRDAAAGSMSSRRRPPRSLTVGCRRAGRPTTLAAVQLAGPDRRRPREAGPRGP